MAEVDASKLPSLAKDYLVEEKEEQQPKMSADSVEVKPSSVDEVVEETEESPSVVSREVAPPATAEEGDGEASDKTADDISLAAPTEAEESKDSAAEAEESKDSAAESENAENRLEAEEETSEIKLETAPADFRFPTTNQSRHCFTRYIEYHRCVAAKGEGAPECDKFAKYYRSLCPGEWVDRWNEQRENGTFPGPL
ncbi:hypothetical protein BUALT_Bualt15G0126500 [Buddleja alternifolia]|uniref:Cytochrome c oxidase subunit 6b-1 n=1 Tax=Buddleja alternifolia TaxID=168488 RepID=A0AAV6WF94_9LAMI|nr:hypothetical protein BUALT_Bualt15G0126500 [Buddleja alternifolia]